MTAFSIDELTYSKRIHPLRHGYSTRGNVRPDTIVIHSTNGVRGSSFDAEARYLRDSALVSAHFLIGKSGQIVQIVPPAYAAWHAGEAMLAYTNAHSIGIELHHAVGDDYPAAQKAALTWLVKQLIETYAIPLDKIDTHRAIAIPGPSTTPDPSQWRKKDPSDWSDASFYAWRAQLTTAVPGARIYQVIAPCAVLTSRAPDAPLAAGPDDGQTHLAPGDHISVGDVANGWLWIAPNTVDPPGIGFIPSAYARPL